MMPATIDGGQRLARRLVLLTLLASGVIAAFITAAQLYLEYDREVDAIRQRFTEIETAYLPSVKQGLWVMDRQALQVLADGIRQLPDFDYAAMRVEGALVAASGTPPPGRALDRTFEIDYHYRGATQRIGTLEVAASDAGPLRRTWERLGFVLLLNSLKAAIIAALVLVLVRHMITLPVSRIHAHTRKMSAGRLDEPLVLAARYPSSQDDEIHELARAVDNMRISLRDRGAALELAAGVFAHTFEGIMITDSAARILSVNPAFTAITGYAASDAVGQTPHLLHSDHQPPSFYRDMWASLTTTGNWRGEIWNRRKDGEAYLQWTSITTIRDAAGQAHRYIAVMTDITEIRRKDEHIFHQAYHDALTDLPNRTLMRNRLDHAIKAAQRDGTRIAVLFIDLDRFKVINDSLGHVTGDELLQRAAKRLTDSVRASDTVSRQGGDEFVILAAIERIADAVHIAEKVIADMDEPFDIGEHRLNVGASVGISVYPQEGDDAATLLRNADVAMYAAKEAGRGTFRFFDPAMNERAQKRLRMEEALRRALSHNEFELFYQPKICLIDSRYCGMEALIRWRDPELGIVSPVDFIPLAEETGLIEPIGNWVLETACAQMRLWADAGRIAGPVAVNISAKQLNNPDFAAELEAILNRHRLEASYLQLEVTESTVMADPETAIEALSKLAALGVTIAIDDFGTGYSSFSYLKRLPIHLLKVDRSFVTDIGRSREDDEIVTAIIQVALALKLMVVAEGVETAQQAAFLNGLGCHFAQGYLYAKPLPVKEFEGLLGA